MFSWNVSCYVQSYIKVEALGLVTSSPTPPLRYKPSFPWHKPLTNPSDTNHPGKTLSDKNHLGKTLSFLLKVSFPGGIGLHFWNDKNDNNDYHHVYIDMCRHRCMHLLQMASLGGIGLYSRHLTDDDVSNIGAATRCDGVLFMCKLSVREEA